MTRRFAVTALVIATLALTGCVANDPLANDVVDENYTSADGAITELAVSNREEPLSFESSDTTDGSTIRSEDYVGSVLVVNFWFAACPPCRYEAPDLAEISAKYAADGVQFLGINVYDEREVANSFEREFAIPYPSILDVSTGELRLAFSGQLPPNGVPTTIIVDRSGRVAARLSGAILDRAVFEDMIESVLAEPTE
jgi:thiol-disulfide isomerase/thioredoxin